MAIEMQESKSSVERIARIEGEIIYYCKPIRGVASVTGSMSPTMVAKIVIASIMVTPRRKEESGGVS
jgi:hypothetical protein